MCEIQGEREPGEDKAHSVIILKGGRREGKQGSAHLCQHLTRFAS